MARAAPPDAKLTPFRHRGYDRPRVASRLPLGTQRLVFITGKGGVGKSAVTAALATAAADAGRRVLAVQAGRGRLGALLGTSALTGEPTRVRPGLFAAAIEPEDALAAFVHGVLRIGMLARRLLESTSFQVLAAAAPGLPELLVLNTLAGWLDARRLGRRAYDLLVVDAPASGHSLPLLAAPRSLSALVRLGPVADMLTRLEHRLADPAETLVCLVTTPEELPVRETIELHREIRALGLPLAPPIVNAVPPRRFGASDEAALARLDPAHPWVMAARFHIERRHEATAQVAALRRELGAAPITLPFLFAGPEAAGGVETLARELGAVTGLAA